MPRASRGRRTGCTLVAHPEEPFRTGRRTSSSPELVMRSATLAIVLVVVPAFLAAAACRTVFGKSASGRQVPGQPVETRPPEAKNQRPAFSGQTRVPWRTEGVAFVAQTIGRDLEHPWALAFLSNTQMLVTERRGRMWVVGMDGSRGEPVRGLPAVDARGQGGLLDVVVDPNYRENSLIYWAYAEPRQGGNGTAVARGKLVLAGSQPRVENLQVILAYATDAGLDPALRMSPGVLARRNVVRHHR